MDANFWLERWEKNDIGFHEGEANAFLRAYFDQLSLPAQSRVFVPLCGKTRDIAWLLSQNHRVAGAELSELAIKQLFAELGVDPDISDLGDLRRYSAPNIDIFVGDIFTLTGQLLGEVDAVYDRAALVALPADMRTRYAAHVAKITNVAPQLLICFEYDQTVMAGPPFSIDAPEVARVYGASYQLTPLADAPVAGGLRGICPAREAVWILR